MKFITKEKLLTSHSAADPHNFPHIS